MRKVETMETVGCVHIDAQHSYRKTPLYAVYQDIAKRNLSRTTQTP